MHPATLKWLLPSMNMWWYLCTATLKWLLPFRTTRWYINTAAFEWLSYRRTQEVTYIPCLWKDFSHRWKHAWRYIHTPPLKRHFALLNTMINIPQLWHRFSHWWTNDDIWIPHLSNDFHNNENVMIQRYCKIKMTFSNIN